MTKRIFRAIFLVALAVFLACLMFMLEMLYGYYGQVQSRQLASQLTLAAQGVERAGLDYLTSLPDAEHRLTWISEDGNVLFDSLFGASQMENHLQREEIQKALQSGIGESARYSSTLMEQTLYRAQRLADGSVLRIAASRLTMLALVVSMWRPFLMILAMALALSYVLAGRLAKRIIRPLEAIDLERPLENDTYDELAPMLRRLDSQRRQIGEQMDRLKAARNEFETITRSMREGLVLLNDKGEIVSINAAASALFHMGDAAPGTPFLNVNRLPEISQAIEQARLSGHAETQLFQEDRIYQLEISRIQSEPDVSGVALIAFDMTEKAQAEKMRREFTANVSHELKTPLQSIMGSAELMENGMVRPEDQPRFLARIRNEVARLVTLIDDIIRLSQLEEKHELIFEACDLAAIAREAASDLLPIAQSRCIRLTVRAGSAPMEGVPQLLREIVYNLTDNAIKYNIDGGKVEISVAHEPGRVTLTVSDTGIGISREHQDRVFERFYRVDKSRSRAYGGTGLGLSIVKHAASLHRGAIELQSSIGCGTTIRIVFPEKS